MLASLSVVHLAALLALTYLTTRRLFAGRLAPLAAGFLLVWANLAYTGLGLSCISKLNSVALYAATSLALAGALLFALRKYAGELRPLALVDGAAEEPWSKWQRVTLAILGSTLALAALGTLIICLRYYANNWDTLAYRFSRVFLYLGQGNLLHFSNGLDPRALYYPINGTLAYLFLAIYQFGGHAFNLVSFFCWAAAGLGVFLFSRVLGATRFGSLAAAWFCLMAPIVLCVASSTNDEILAAAPTVVGLMFVVRALRHWSRRCIVLGAVGMGLGFGVKLHWAFFAPFIVIAGVAAAIAFVRSEALRNLWRRRVPELALGALLAAPLVLGFAVLNLMSSGKLTHVEFMTAAINSPFRLDVAAQKIKINTAQLFLAPIPDLEVHFNADARRAPYARFNKWMNDAFFQNVNRADAFRVVPYQFQGVADPTGFNYFEQTLWLGFLPVLLLVGIVAGVVRRNLSMLALATCSLLFLWHLSYAAQTKYAEAISTYYSYPAVLACAGLGLVVDRMRWREGVAGKLLLLTGAGVVVTHIVFDFNVLAFNVQRNVPEALAKNFDGETGVTRTTPRVIEAIRANQRIHIPYQHWELLFWTYMRQNPGARYTTSQMPLTGEPDALQLLSMESGTMAGKLVGRRPAGRSPGVVFLGTTYSGFENVLAFGAGVEKKYPADANYFVVPATFQRRADNLAIEKIVVNSNAIVGLVPADEVEFRVVAECQDGTRQTGKWLTPSSGIDELAFSGAQVPATVTLEARMATQPARTCVLVSPVTAGIRPDQHVCASASGGPLRLVLPGTAPGQESTKWSGRDYLVRWLGQRTEITIHNPGTAEKAEVRMELGINKNPKTITIAYAGGATAPVKVDKWLWAHGPQSVKFVVPLKPGENRMTLITKEPEDKLPDGRPASLLLIGEMTATSDAGAPEAAPSSLVIRRTVFNCYCGRTETAATQAYRSMQTDGGKAIGGLFEKGLLVELESQTAVGLRSASGSYSKVEVTTGKNQGALCWLPSSILQ